jgi:hypothetical protein
MHPRLSYDILGILRECRKDEIAPRLELIASQSIQLAPHIIVGDVWISNVTVILLELVPPFSMSQVPVPSKMKIARPQ